MDGFADKLAFMRLWDIYGKLLTPTQREITDMYLNLDLTVSEIAEQKGISRQGVSECLGLCKAQLGDYEQKLGCARVWEERRSLAAEVEAWADDFSRSHPSCAEEIAVLRGILGKQSAAAPSADGIKD